jgi:hypothetical protein
MSDTAQAGATALPKAIPTAHDRSFVPYPMGLDPEFEKCLPGYPGAGGRLFQRRP